MVSVVVSKAEPRDSDLVSFISISKAQFAMCWIFRDVTNKGKQLLSFILYFGFPFETKLSSAHFQRYLERLY